MTKTISPPTSTESIENFRRKWRQWPPEVRSEFLASLTIRQRDRLNLRFKLHCHDHQLPPLLASNGELWSTWLLIGGRGAGKTRAGAEWVKSIANAPKGDGEGERRIALMYEQSLSRPASDDEPAAAMAFLRAQAAEYGISFDDSPNDERLWADLCHVMLNVKEFVFVR